MSYHHSAVQMDATSMASFGALEPLTDPACKCINIISGSIHLPCLNPKEEKRSSKGVSSKVSQIATMFQSTDESDEKDDSPTSPGPATVVRTQSHVARFNTARALFEKMSEEKKSLKSGKSRSNNHHKRNQSSPSKTSSRSPSPPIAASRSTIHSNGFSSSQKPKSIATISSSYTASLHGHTTPPSLHSVMVPSGENILSARTFSETSDRNKRSATEEGNHREKPRTEVKCSKKDVCIKAEPKCKPHSAKPLVSSMLDASLKQEVSAQLLNQLGRNYNSPSNSDFVGRVNTANVSSSHPKSAKYVIESKKVHHKTPKPEEKRAISHQQNQQLIQRHKNWFQSFSKTKSPMTSPNKMDATSVIPESRSFAGLDRDTRERSKSTELLEEEKWKITSCKKIAHEIHRKSLDELDDSRPNVAEWTRERNVKFKSGNSRDEEDGKVCSISEKVQPYDDVSTLPSYWSPPKHYNESAPSKHSNDVTHSRQFDSPSLNSTNNEEFSSLDSYRDTSKGGGAPNYRDQRIASQSLPRKPRSDDHQQSTRHNQQSITSVHHQRTSHEPINPGVSQPVPLRRTLDSNPKYEEGTGSLKRSSCEIKLQQKQDTNFKRSSVEADRELRLREWEKKRTDRLSDEIKVHNIRAPDIRAFTKEKKCTDEVIWVKREDFNDGKTTLERKRHSYPDKEDTFNREEEFERKKKELADLAVKEQDLDRIKKPDEFERRKKEEKIREIERHRKEELEKKFREEELYKKQKEEEERKRKEQEMIRKRKEVELERKRKEEEMERRQREELERKLKEVEMDRKRMAEELEIQRREEQLERKHREEELERKRKEEADRKKREQELEHARKEEELEKKREEEELKRKQQQEEEEELERKQQEEELRRKQEEELEIKRREEELEIKRREEELEIKRREEELEIKRREEELEIKRREEELEIKRREEELEIRRQEEELKIRRQEEEMNKKRQLEELEEKQEYELEMKRQKEELERKQQEKELERKQQEEELARQQQIEKLEREETKVNQQEELDRKQKEQDVTKIEEDDVIYKTEVVSNRTVNEELLERANVQQVETERSQRVQLNEENEKLSFDEQERQRKEKDRIEIEKTKKRIAELKKERDEIQRKKAFRMQLLLKGEDPALVPEPELSSDSDSEEVRPSFLDANISITIEPPSSPHRTQESFDQSELSEDPLTADEVPSQEEVINTEDKHNDGIAALDALVGVSQSVAANDEEDKDYDSVECDRDSLEGSSDQISEEVYYDTTVTSAQHKIDEFCTSPIADTEALQNGRNSSYYSQHNASTISSDFEPLPPPIPPHNVNPATLAQNNSEHPSPIPTQRPVHLGQLTQGHEPNAGPEVMTPEEEQKLLSHNVFIKRYNRSLNSILTDAEASEVSKILSDERDSKEIEDLSIDKSPSFEGKSLPEPPVEEVNKSLDDDEVSGVPVGQTTEEGFVRRTKEVHFEDGIHYFEDGHFWIEVPGLQDDEDDDLPEDVPVHKHTKIKFSTGPIQLFSTFSVNDYDRKNEDVDPVAASAEYELEKRVEKMDVFPVQIDKGDGGLGLSIIGMGVGADAGVEKLGIFVKTITPGGATNLDGRIKVNDQIIEVDNKSLVGVTQMFAASVLKNTNGTVDFLIGREQDPENSEVAMLIRQSLMADMERDDRRRALGGPNYEQESAEMFESFSSPSGGDSDENSRNNASQYEEPSEQNLYGANGAVPYNNQFTDSYGSNNGGPVSSSSIESFNRTPDPVELLSLTQHMQEVQQRNQMYEEEINMLRSKINGLEREIGDQGNVQSAAFKVQELEEQIQAKQKELIEFNEIIEKSQGQFVVLEKKYYKAKKIIKEYQSRERDFLHREEYHINQLEEKDALYNSLVKALKDRVIQLEADLVKAQETAGLPIKLPPDLNSQSSSFVHFGSSILQDNQKEPPHKPTALEADLSDTEGCETLTSEDSKASTVERKINYKEEDLDVAIPPHELLDVSFSRAKGELASRGGLAKRHLPSLKKTASSSSASSFERSLDDSVDETLVPSESPSKKPLSPNEGEMIEPCDGFTRPPPYQPSHIQHSSATYHPNSPPHMGSPHRSSSPHLPSQPPPYQPPPSAPLAGHRLMGATERQDAPYRHQPPIARVHPVNRMEVTKSPTSPPPRTPQQQSLANQLKAMLSEREFPSDLPTSPNSSLPQSPVKKSPSMLMEDVRQAVLQANMSIGKKPTISGPIHISSTAQVVSTGQFVNNRTGSPIKNGNSSIQQRVSRDSGSWSPNLGKNNHHSSSSIVSPSSSPGVVLLSQRPIDTSLPPIHNPDDHINNSMDMKASGSQGSLTDLAFDSPVDSNKSFYSREPISIMDWNKDQVAHWLVSQGMEVQVPKFMSAGITGPRLVNLDTKDLKHMGLSSDDKNKIKRKVKELRQNLERERKQIEKEKKEKEKLQKKAEKLAEKAEKKKK